jgi:uncharacterized protein (DUF433 family)
LSALTVFCYRSDMNAILESNVVSRSPQVMSGAAVFVGTRVTVQSLFDYLAGGHTLEEFLDDFPTVDREQATKLLHELSHSFEVIG